MRSSNALLLATLNWAWAARRFGETLPPERRGGAAEGARSRQPFRALKEIDQPGVRTTCTAYFVYLIAFGAMEFTLVFLARERLGFDEKQNGMMFVFIGLVIAFVQGGLVRRLAPRFGEHKLAVGGMALTVPGFVLVAGGAARRCVVEAAPAVVGGERARAVDRRVGQHVVVLGAAHLEAAVGAERARNV